MKKLKPIPKFKSPQEENKFWQEHDSTEYLDWDQAKKTRFPNLKPSTKTISIRLPEDLLYEVKIMANQRDVPYQSLIKMLLSKSLKRARRS